MISQIYAITQDKAPNINSITQIINKHNISILQYRHKIKDFNTKILEAMELFKLCQKLGVLLIINDDIKLAKIIGADGVHLGANDGDIVYARQQLGAKAIIGISCYNDINLAKKAEKLGANYCGFGSIFPSMTKPNAKQCSLKVLSQAKQQLTIPIVAIGGINFNNKQIVLSAGADSVAMICALFNEVSHNL